MRIGGGGNVNGRQVFPRRAAEERRTGAQEAVSTAGSDQVLFQEGTRPPAPTQPQKFRKHHSVALLQ